MVNKIQEDIESLVKVTPAVEAKTKVVAPAMVEIKKEDLEALLKRVEKQSEDIELLYKATDKARLAKAIGTEEKLIKTAKIRKWEENGKLVIGWKLTRNICEVVNGRWVEDQQVTMVFEDGTNETASLIDFVRKTLQKEVGDIISKTSKIDEKGESTETFTIQLPNGKKLLIGSAYIN